MKKKNMKEWKKMNENIRMMKCSVELSRNNKGIRENRRNVHN